MWQHAVCHLRTLTEPVPGLKTLWPLLLLKQPFNTAHLTYLLSQTSAGLANLETGPVVQARPEGGVAIVHRRIEAVLRPRPKADIRVRGRKGAPCALVCRGVAFCITRMNLDPGSIQCRTALGSLKPVCQRRQCHIASFSSIASSMGQRRRWPQSSIALATRPASSAEDLPRLGLRRASGESVLPDGPTCLSYKLLQPRRLRRSQSTSYTRFNPRGECCSPCAPPATEDAPGAAASATATPPAGAPDGQALSCARARSREASTFSSRSSSKLSTISLIALAPSSLSISSPASTCWVPKRP